MHQLLSAARLVPAGQAQMYCYTFVVVNDKLDNPKTLHNAQDGTFPSMHVLTFAVAILSH